MHSLYCMCSNKPIRTEYNFILAIVQTYLVLYNCTISLYIKWFFQKYSLYFFSHDVSYFLSNFKLRNTYLYKSFYIPIPL